MTEAHTQQLPPALGVWAPRIVGGLAFVFYALLAPPGHFWLDSGELSAAAFQLGSAHPTGFSLYSILAKVVTWVPVGDIAFRINLFSAICAAVATTWTASLILEIGGRTRSALVGAIAGALCMATTFLVARHATVAEVYPLSVALLVMCVRWMVRAARSEDAIAGLSVAVVFGLAVTHHGVLRLLLGGPMLVLFIYRLRSGARWPLWMPALTALTAAAMLAYLPVRSSAQDVVDWGHPDTLSAVVHHAQATEIREVFGEEMFSTDSRTLSHHANIYASQIFDSLGPVALVCALAGFVFLVLRRRWEAAVFGWIAGCDWVYGVWINPMGLVDLQNGAPLAWAVSVLAGMGIAWLCMATGRGGMFVGGAATAVALAFPVLGSVEGAWSTGRGDSPAQWASAGLAQAQPRTPAFVVSDSMAAGMLYAQVVEQARPDVPVFVRQLLVDRRRTAETWERAGQQQAGASAKEISAGFASVPWEPGSEQPTKRSLHPAVPLFTAQTGMGGSQTEWREALEETLEWLSRADARDASARANIASAVNQLGIDAVRRAGGKGAARRMWLGRAMAAFDAAIRIDPLRAQVHANRGAALSRLNDFQGALESTVRSLGLRPEHAGTHINAARYALQLRDFKRAQVFAERAAQLAPGRAEAHALAATAAWLVGDRDGAHRRVEQALKLDPNQPEALAIRSKLQIDP